LSESFLKLSTSEVTLSIIHAGVGAVSESDVMLASASHAMIIAFNVRPEPKAKQLAENEGVEIKTYNIIYNAIDDIRLGMGGLLAPTTQEKTLGRAEIRQVFNAPKVGTVAGCSVVDGKITRSARVRLLRDHRQVFEGKITSLKRFKDDAREVAQGFECGIVLEGFNDIKVADVIEAYEVEEVARTLDSSPRTSPTTRVGGDGAAPQAH